MLTHPLLPCWVTTVIDTSVGRLGKNGHVHKLTAPWLEREQLVATMQPLHG